MRRVRSIALGFVVSLSAGYSVADTCWIETVSIFNTLPGYTSPAVFLEPMGIEAAVEESGERWLKHDEGFRIQRLITAFVNPRMNEVWDRFPDFRGRPLQISSRYFCVSDKADLLSRRARLVTAAGRMTLMGDWTKALNAPAVASPSRSNETAGHATGAASRNLSKDEIAQANYDRLKLEQSEPNSLAARRAGIEYRDRLLLSIQSGAMPDLKVAQTDISDALAEWQKAKREFPTSDHTKRLKKDYDYLVKIKGEQDKPARVRGPVLTRVETKQPSAEDIAARKKAQDADRKRKADEAAIVRAREAEDKKKSEAGEEKRRASCMKPENRNNCGCGRFYPGSSGGTCSR